MHVIVERKTHQCSVDTQRIVPKKYAKYQSYALNKLTMYLKTTCILQPVYFRQFAHTFLSY